MYSEEELRLPGRMQLSDVVREANRLLSLQPELAKSGEISERTISFYVQKKLLPRRLRRGPKSFYEPSYVYRVLFIRLLQSKGLSLEDIHQRYVLDAMSKVDDRSVRSMLLGEEPLEFAHADEADESVTRGRSLGEEAVQYREDDVGPPLRSMAGGGPDAPNVPLLPRVTIKQESASPERKNVPGWRELKSMVAEVREQNAGIEQALRAQDQERHRYELLESNRQKESGQLYESIRSLERRVAQLIEAEQARRSRDSEKGLPQFERLASSLQAQNSGLRESVGALEERVMMQERMLDRAHENLALSVETFERARGLVDDLMKLMAEQREADESKRSAERFYAKYLIAPGVELVLREEFPADKRVEFEEGLSGISEIARSILGQES